MLRSIPNFAAGHVSKTALLTKLLPLSFASCFGTLIAAAFLFPARYDWHERVISHLISPRHNPHGYWLPSLGIAAAVLLAWPFAGYVEQRLRPITPRLARAAGVALALGFLLVLLAIVAQIAQPVLGVRWLHEFLARASAAIFAVGMICCCVCMLKDRLRFLGGQRSLGTALAFCWASLTLLPIGCLAIIGTLMLLGHQADQAWAENARQSFRHTILWQLAFWEWVGAVAAFAFLAVSVLFLPATRWQRRTTSACASMPRGAGTSTPSTWASAKRFESGNSIMDKTTSNNGHFGRPGLP